MARRTSTRKYLADKMSQGIGGRVSVTEDERTCPQCRAMAGKYTTQTPPFHPNCRCSISR